MPRRDTVRYHLTIQIADGPAQHVRFEPGGPEVDLPRGDTLRLDIEGPEGQLVEINHGVGWIQVDPGPGVKAIAYDGDGAPIRLLGYDHP